MKLVLFSFYCLSILFSTSNGEEGVPEESSSNLESNSELRKLMLEMEATIKQQSALIAQQEVTSKLQSEAIQKLQAMLQESKVDETAKSESDLSEPNHQRVSRADDYGYRLTPVVNQLTQKVAELEAKMQAVQTTQAQQVDDAGTVYTRWGNTACPIPEQLVYSGLIGGTYFGRAGGASNHLCLPTNPVISNHTAPPYFSLLYGGEYETPKEPQNDLEPACAVCRLPRSSVLMIPATDTCDSGWTKEYSGYLMANSYTAGGASDFICVDSEFGYLPGTQANQNGRLLYYTLTECGSLPCPPYVSRKVTLCVVCSR